MQADCLTAFSGFLDALQLQRLTIPNQKRSVYDLTSGTATYTIGTGGTFNQDRPVWIDRIGLIVGSQEYPLRMFTLGEWARIPQKSLSGQPVGVYFNDNFPLGELTFYPVPDVSTHDVAIYWPDASPTTVASANTELSIPPGWDRMLTYNLAVEFGMLFGVSIRPEIAEIARASLADVKRSNIRPEVLTFDPALTGRRASLTRSRFDGGNF